MRRLLIGMLFLLLLPGISPNTLAQTPNWGIWQSLAYDFENGVIYRFDSSGNLNSFSLPMPASSVETVPRIVTASRDGRYLVYTAYNEEKIWGEGPYNATMMIYDTQTATASEYPFVGIYHHSLDFHSTQYIFSPDSTQLAIGYYQASGWFIAVLNLVNQTYGAVLDSNSPAAIPVNTGAVVTYQQPLPVITNFDGINIEFAMFPGETLEGILSMNSFSWNISSGIVSPTLRYQTFDYDYFPPTNEVIQPIQSMDFPSQDIFPYGHNNALVAVSPDNQEIPFLASFQSSLFNPTFVQNGNKVLYNAYDGNTGSTWTVMNRNGGPTMDISAPIPGMDLGMGDVAGTELGMLAVTETSLAAQRLGLPLQGGRTIMHIIVSDNRPIAFDPVFNTPEDTFIDLIWVSYTVTQPQSGYAAWANPNNIAPQTLAVGGQALIFTTAGDQLNLRSGAGTQFSIVDKLNNGETVTLLEGPVSSGGLLWWRVESPRGAVGWTVESADNVQTLQPTGSVTIAPPVTNPLLATPLSQTLQIGGQARVLLVPQDAANVRANPNASARIAGTLNGGTVVNVVGGPTGADGFIWWQVQGLSGTPVGWVAEAIPGSEQILGRYP